MAWHYNKKVNLTYSTSHKQNCWAYIDTVGWRKIKPNESDGVTNVYAMMCAAKGNNRLVNVFTDGDNQITTAYLK